MPAHGEKKLVAIATFRGNIIKGEHQALYIDLLISDND
jgi:hypothetical protein